MLHDIINNIQPNAEAILNKYGLSVDEYVLIVASGIAIKKQLPHFSQGKISSLHKELFPEKPPRGTVLNWLSTFSIFKLCKACGNFKSKDEFRINKSKTDGLNSHCRNCHSKATAMTQPARQAAYRAAKEYRTPYWADLAAIKVFYTNCPDGYQVDHIIPLQGELVSGLHVETNLQYLPTIDNQKKGNKYDTTTTN